MPRPLRSTSVRLALGYVALFIASSLLLVSFLWWRTADYLGRKTDAAIAADAREIADELGDFGLPGAIEAIHVRIAEGPGQAFYLLADRRLGGFSVHKSAVVRYRRSVALHGQRLTQESGHPRVSVMRTGVPKQ